MSSKETVLVVDDEENIIALTRLYLEREGFAVESAKDGLEALEKVKSVAPVLMVLDLLLPELDGLQVCKRVHSKRQMSPPSWLNDPNRFEAARGRLTGKDRRDVSAIFWFLVYLP